MVAISIESEISEYFRADSPGANKNEDVAQAQKGEVLIEQSDREYSVTITSTTSTGTQSTSLTSSETTPNELGDEYLEELVVSVVSLGKSVALGSQQFDAQKKSASFLSISLSSKDLFDTDDGLAEESRFSESISRSQIMKLILIGIALTCITNFPSAFMHTSVNTAVGELNAYINNSYMSRGTELDIKHFSLIRSFMHSIWYVGQVVGALVSPYICDTYGRKPAYILATVMMTGACALQMAATLFPYPEVMVLGRVFASIFSPMSDAVAILYFQEISPTNLRGTLSSLFATGYSAMALLGMIFGIKHIFGHSLTLLFSVPIIPGVFAILFLSWIPETPKFLMITRNDIAAASKSIKFFQGFTGENAQKILSHYKQELKEEKGSTGDILCTFTKFHLRKALVLSLAVMVPTLPFYPILQSSTYFLLSLGINSQLAQLSSTAMMLVLTICCIFAALLIEKFSRRALIIGFGIGSQLALSVFVISTMLLTAAEDFGFSNSQHLVMTLRCIAVLGLVGYTVCYGLAIGPISYFIAPELVPIQNRSSMFCVCFGLCSCLVVVTNFSTLPLYEMIGPVAFLPLFIVPSLCALVYLYIQLPETKDREIHEIVSEIKGGRKFANIVLCQRTIELGETFS